jgi:hypothetical protein
LDARQQQQQQQQPPDDFDYISLCPNWMETNNNTVDCTMELVKIGLEGVKLLLSVSA